jgi:SAM-dependent methyltransferase
MSPTTPAPATVRPRSPRHLLVRLLGWRATILQGDPTVTDRWKWLRKHLRPGPLRTLDAGCGTGAFTMYAAKVGNRALGLAFDAGQLEAARVRAGILGLDGAEFRVGDLRHLADYAHTLGQFDQVILFETIEHVLDDAGLVANVAGLVRPGGRLLLTAPYQHHRKLFGEKVSPVEDGGHVRFGYTHEGVADLFARAGLEVEASEYVGGLVSQKLASLQFALMRLVGARGAWLATLPLRVVHGLDGPLTRLFRYPCLSVALVGRKPDGAGGRRA